MAPLSSQAFVIREPLRGKKMAGIRAHYLTRHVIGEQYNGATEWRGRDQVKRDSAGVCVCACVPVIL